MYETRLVVDTGLYWGVFFEIALLHKFRSRFLATVIHLQTTFVQNSSFTEHALLISQDIVILSR